MTRVAVFGAGPTGLVAAHAAIASGADVTIYSRKRKSFMFGAQYLHAPIPGVECGDPAAVMYMLRGTPEDYRRKVYGEAYEGVVSPQTYSGIQEAFDIRATYDRLWERYNHIVVDTNITPSWLTSSFKANEFDAVFSSLPQPQLCIRSEHEFKQQSILAMGDAPEYGLFVPMFIVANAVICNGNPEPSWYRLSNIFGYKTVEWSDSIGFAPNPLRSQQAVKPLSNDCNCWPNITRIGRFGKWQKGWLVHHAYDDVTYKLLSLV